MSVGNIFIYVIIIIIITEDFKYRGDGERPLYKTQHTMRTWTACPFLFKFKTILITNEPK